MSNGQGSGRMSIIQACAFDDLEMTTELREVLGLIGTYSDEQGWCYVGQQKMGDRLGFSREYINRKIRKLRELGYIEVHHRYRKDRGQAVNYYRVLHDFRLPRERYRVLPENFMDPDEASRVIVRDHTPCERHDDHTPCEPHSDHTNNVPIERPNRTNHSLASAAREPIRSPAMPAAAPRVGNFEFLDHEPLYHEALKHFPAPITRSERGAWATAVKNLRDAGVKPQHIPLAIAAWPHVFPSAKTITLNALDRQWSRLMEAVRGSHSQDRAEHRAAEAEERAQRKIAAIEALLASLDGTAVADSGRVPSQV